MIGVLLSLAVALLATPGFDKVLLKDGRTIEGTIVPSTDPAIVKLKLAGAEIPIRADLVAKTYVENLQGYVPKNKQEEDNLKKGWVLFEGQWMSKDRREAELKKRADADKTAISEARKRQQWKNAVTRETTHFAIKSNCDDAIVSDYANRLEDFYKYFTSDWGVSLTPGESKGKMQVALHRSFLDIVRMVSSGGTLYFIFNFDGGDISLSYDADDPHASYRSLYGSAFSQLTYYINPKFYYPSWLRSAMAAYYSTAEPDGKGRFALGGLIHDYVYQLQEDKKAGKIPPLKEAVMTEDFEQTYIHTAMRWSFAHFLMQSPKYGKSFKAFYGSLSKNNEAGLHQANTQKSTITVTEPQAVVSALEKRLGTSFAQLEKEWLATVDYPDAKMGAQDCFDSGVAALSRESKEEDDSNVELAFVFFGKAEEQGMATPYFFRRYAQLLRVGGTDAEGNRHTPHQPDTAKAWTMIQKAIDLDPINYTNYFEAARILLVDGPSMDIDRAAALADTGLAVGGSRDAYVKSIYDSLIEEVEPARERRRASAEAAAAEVANDHRNWHVTTPKIEGQPEPEVISNLKTTELRELIRAGKVGPENIVFQSWFDNDPATGQPVKGENPWDKEWIKLKDIPLFADDLKVAAASGGASGAPGAPAGGAAGSAGTGAGSAPAGGSGGG